VLFWKGKIMGWCLTFGGGFIVGLQFAAMFHNPQYEGSWVKVAIAFGIAVFGGFIGRAGRKPPHSSGMLDL
jgi:hypothetical protein